MMTQEKTQRQNFDPNGNNSYLTESGYEEQMKNLVEPVWQNGEHGMFQGARGTLLTYHYILPESPKAVIVIVPGTSETMLKYKEFCYDAIRFGYGVFLFDHRGHGLSGRLCESMDIVHVDRFQYYVDDLRSFIDKVVKANFKGPLLLFGHSLGGLIAASLLAEENHGISAATLSAPMFEINLGGFPRGAALFVLRCLTALGFSTRYTFGQRPSRGARTIHEAGTFSFQRFAYYYRQLRQDPSRLLMGGVSHGWLYECLKASKKALTAKSKITVPLLVLAAGRDNFVGVEGQRRFMTRASQGQFELIEDAAHESYNDIDQIRTRVMNRIFHFFETQTSHTE